MKKVHLILQSKGGCGKSLLTWFLANYYADKEEVYFMDVDESTKTSSSRLEGILSPERVSFFPILNEQKRLERELFLAMFERISRLKANLLFLDFGAPESEEFKKLLEFEISAESLVEELRELGIELVLFVVVAGRDAFTSSIRFYEALLELADSTIETRLLMNEGTYGGIEAVAMAKQNLLAMDIPTVYTFGNLGDSQSGKDIIKIVASGQKPENMSLAVKLTFKKAMSQIEQLMNANDDRDETGEV